jgi:tRNA nucleotidyltransferase (CCA-adding enzyme)
MVYLAALLRGLDTAVIRRTTGRLALSPRTTQRLLDGLAAAETACDRLCNEGNRRPSEVVAGLRTLPLEMFPLLLALCPDGEVHRYVERYLTTWRDIRASLTGDDLKRLGVPQGPQIGRLLARVLAAKLDGEAPTREAEEALVRRDVLQPPASCTSVQSPPATEA